MGKEFEKEEKTCIYITELLFTTLEIKQLC